MTPAKMNAMTPNEQTTEADHAGGAWVALHSDYSGISIFATEIEALRHAVDKSMTVRFVPWGGEIR